MFIANTESPGSTFVALGNFIDKIKLLRKTLHDLRLFVDGVPGIK